MEGGVLRNLTRGTETPIKPLPAFMLKVLSDGGLAAHFVKYGTFDID
jgi:3-isopropylmalate/(R)-2-methylmalate dehydratase small subunit